MKETIGNVALFIASVLALVGGIICLAELASRW